MSEEKSLSAKQLAVIEDLFEGEQEHEILKKHKLSRKIYEKWLVNEAFKDQLDRRITWEYRRSELMLARKARQAVSNLVKLTEPEKGEIARKACVDLITISANRSAGNNTIQAVNPSPSPESPPFTHETAGKLLAVLAKEKTAENVVS